MPNFKVTYKCPECGYEDTIEHGFASKSAALNSVSAPCPNHRHLGPLKANSVEEAKKKK